MLRYHQMPSYDHKSRLLSVCFKSLRRSYASILCLPIQKYDDADVRFDVTNGHSDLFILGYKKLPMRLNKRPSLKDILLMTVDDLVDFVETSGIYNLRHPGTHEVLRKIWQRLVQIFEKMGFLLNAIEDSNGTIVLHPSTRRALLPLGIIFMVSRSTLPYAVRDRSFPGYALVCVFAALHSFLYLLHL